MAAESKQYQQDFDIHLCADCPLNPGPDGLVEMTHRLGSQVINVTCRRLDGTVAYNGYARCVEADPPRGGALPVLARHFNDCKGPDAVLGNLVCRAKAQDVIVP